MLPEVQHLWYGHPEHTNTAEHQNKLLKPSTRLVHSAPYCTCSKTCKLEKTKIDKMLTKNIIELARTEWATLIVFPSKKDGTLRICVDYRKLNVVSKRGSYPIPRMIKCIDSLNNAVVFQRLM